MGKVAIVTGASSGIGESVARKLRSLDFTVYAVARRVERMEPLAALGVHTVKVDVTVDEDLVALVDRVMAESGRVDVLVNNAGYGSYGSLEEVPMDEARRQVDVNLFALARLTQLVVPHMREQRSGTIINVSSIGGRFGEPLGAWYHATKFAVEGLSESLRPELAPFGIHVVVIEPGAIRTEWAAVAAEHMLQSSQDGPYADQAALSSTVFTGAATERASSPDVVADAVAKAVTARRPKTRYVVGMLAKPIVYGRKFLPDRTFDRIMAAGVKRMAG